MIVHLKKAQQFQTRCNFKQDILVINISKLIFYRSLETLLIFNNNKKDFDKSSSGLLSLDLAIFSFSYNDNPGRMVT